MPIYSMRNNDTLEEFEVNLKYSDLEQYLQNNPNTQQIFNRFPATGDSVRLGIRKPDDGFRDALKEVKSAHKKNTIEVR